MSVHDAVRAYRRHIVLLIERSGNRRAACRAVGIHHSTFYRWRAEALAVAEDTVTAPTRRRVSWQAAFLEDRIVAAALAFPALGPQRVADELATQGITVSATRVWRTLGRHRLNTRALRYALLATHRHTATDQRSVMVPPGQSRRRFIRSLNAEKPGDLVQLDCFHIGSFKETRIGKHKDTRGVIWQYTAIDVASSWVWAELHMTRHNPDPALTSKLAHRIAADLTRWGWTWKAASTDNGNEYRASVFRDTLADLGIEHRFIRAGRPQSNGKVERVQGTILEELWRPALINYVQPSISGLRRDLTDYLNHYNWHRPHRGKWNQGQPPATIIIPKANTRP